jgi:hypothetical protein
MRHGEYRHLHALEQPDISSPNGAALRPGIDERDELRPGLVVAIGAAATHAVAT